MQAGPDRCRPDSAFRRTRKKVLRQAWTVQLQEERMEALEGEGPDDEEETIEETSREQRSKLDYRNVESDLTPAQQDLLNQEQIPRPYRNLIKNYFQAIRPRGSQ